MDKERARFVLSCFRPDGADAADPDFAAALQLAAADRELGEWLAKERARDGRFAVALSTLDIPHALRDSILAAFAEVRGDVPQAADSLDAAMIGALASQPVPPALRAQILLAMERTTTRHRAARWRSWLGVPLAAAAGVALAWFLWPVMNNTKTEQPGIAAHRQLTASAVEAGFIRTFESPSFSLDLKQPDQAALYDHIHARSLPCPCPDQLPRGLSKAPGIGCRELVIDGHRGTLICFERTPAGIVHLVVFERDDVCDCLPCRKHPDFDQSGRWTVAHWADNRHAYFLIGESDATKLAGLF